ncbi:MAG: NADH-quinone oxidoreductase subunit N, partial [Chloroflexi bacterium]|nr:NADH-quinone oxidoreductase subunit N [Chloroflexota bacterium]
MPLDAVALGIRFLPLAPEVILGVTAVAVILLDLAVRNKVVLAWVSGIGVAFAAMQALVLWGVGGTPDISFSGVFLLDRYALFFKLLVLGATFLVVLASPDYVGRFPRFQGEYYGLVLLAAVGMMVVVSAAELVSIYLALEIQTFALVALTTFLKDARSAESGLKFLLVSAVSTAVMLYGMALLFGLTGTTFLTGIAPEVALRLGAGITGENVVLILAGVLLLAGFGFKIASVPFQMWVPDVYEGGATPVIAYLSVASKA